MPTVGTTAILALSSPARPVSFELHADADNTDTILYSTQEPQVPVDSAGELTANQSTSYSNFIGSLWLKAEASGQNYSIGSVQYADADEKVSEEVVRS